MRVPSENLDPLCSLHHLGSHGAFVIEEPPVRLQIHMSFLRR